MEITNFAPIFEVFFGLNLASSIFDNFSMALFEHFTNFNKYNKKIISQKEKLKQINTKLSQVKNKKIIPNHQIIKNISKKIDETLTELTTIKSKVLITKYFDDNCFIASFLCFFFLILIAIDVKLNPLNLTTTIFICISINLYFIISSLLDHYQFLESKVKSVRRPVVIFIFLLFSSFFIAAYLEHNYRDYFIKVGKIPIAMLIIITPISHFICYFIVFSFQKSYYEDSLLIQSAYNEIHLSNYLKNINDQINKENTNKMASS